MITVILMGLVTILSIFLMLKVGRVGKAAAVEVAVAKGWSKRFAKQTLEEKKEAYLERNQKYHLDAEKKAAKKVKAWDKQIVAYQKEEEAYLSGKKFTLLDMISLFGYQLLVDFKLDGDSDILRKLTLSCERTGYVELERNQETGGKKNAAIYAYYLLATVFSYAYVGVILSLFLGVLTMGAGNEAMGIVLPMVVGLAGPALAGYISYDNINARAKKRQDEIERSFPNAISKIALLVTAGMNITKAIQETAGSDSALIYRELQLVVQEMNRGAALQSALVRLQCRCDNAYLDKMITIVTKSYVSGNANLAGDLKAINDECWLNKKHNARRMGEQIQNKLFVPTMLMFIGILVVIIVPAMSGFSF